MRLATWNVNGIRARLDLLRLWLRERRPDVLGIQELKADDDKFPRAEIEAEGYRAAVHGQKGWNGVAVLTREEVEIVRAGLPAQEEMGARFLTVDAAGIRFTTVYVPNGKSVDHDDYARKLDWLDALAAHLDRPDRPAIVCGDFNVVPAPADTWDEAKLAGTIFHTDAERARLLGLGRLGWADLYRAKNPDTKAFTWWDYRAAAFPRNLGLRIDLMLGSADVARRVRSVEIDRDWRKKRDGLTPSDHVPVVADVD